MTFFVLQNPNEDVFNVSKFFVHTRKSMGSKTTLDVDNNFYFWDAVQLTGQYYYYYYLFLQETLC